MSDSKDSIDDALNTFLNGPEAAPIEAISNESFEAIVNGCCLCLYVLSHL